MKEVYGIRYRGRNMQESNKVVAIATKIFNLLLSYALYLIPYTLYLPVLLPSAHAQQFKAGLLGGISTSQVDGDTYAGYDKVGVMAGAFVSRKFLPESKWHGLFEITYIQKGSRKIPHPDKGDYADYSLKLDYIEVPVMFKYDFAVSDTQGVKKMKFALIGGLAVGSLIHSEERDAFGALTSGTDFQKNDISTILGLGYYISEHIGFDIRTQYSILPVRKGGTSTYYPNWTNKIFKPGYYNNLLLFCFKYQF